MCVYVVTTVDSSTQSDQHMLEWVIGAVLAAVLLTVVVVILIIIFWKRRKQSRR